MKNYFIYPFILSLLLLTGIQKGTCQNLVPNPSFEDTVSCPTFASQIDKAIGWQSSRNSPDYFNECDLLIGNQGVPNNSIGFQYAYEGNAYAGFITYSRSGINYREHLVCNLINPLEVNKKYNVSYFVSLGNNYSGLATNNLGVLFTTATYSFQNWSPVNNICQINSNFVQTDTLNWIQVSGSFIADSAYTSIVIGNFYDDQNTDTIYHPPASHSYYYIDNVEVSEDTLTSTENLALSNLSKIYPNPIDELFYIKSSDKIILRVEIFNLLGDLVFDFVNSSSSTSLELNIKDLDSNLFFLRINYVDSISSFHRVLKN